MQLIAKITSWIALAGTILPALVYLSGSMALPRVQTTMLVATLVWFGTVPLWMGRKTPGG